MASNPPIQQRKRPTQERSRATCEAILEAAARVLVEDGFERATTNRIAAVAGVSIGSLYQYFPNKESLVFGLLERHLIEAARSVPPALRDGAESLRATVRAVVEWQLALHAENPALHEVLTLCAPRVAGDEFVRAFERNYQATIRWLLESHREQIRPLDLELASFVVARSLESLTHGAVIHRPDLLDHPGLAAEITELVVRYLEGDESPP